MKCAQAEKWMDAALDELSGGEDLVPRGWSEHRRAELDEHLAGCPQCRLQWGALRSAELALRSPKPVAAPETLLAEFRQRLAEETDPLPRRTPAERSRSPWGWIWPMGSLAAAGAAAAAVLMFNVHVPPTATVRQPAATPPAAHDNDHPSELGASTPRRGLGSALAEEAKQPERTGPAAPNKAWAANGNILALEAKPRVGHEDYLVSKLKAPLLAETTEPENVRAKKRLEALSPSQPVVSNAATRVAADFHRPQGETRWNFDVYRTEPGTQLGADAAGIRLAQNAEQNFFFGIQQGQVLYGTDAAQTAAQLTAQNANLAYAQVSLEPLPAELNVSSALLTALQRPVEVELANAPVQEVADQLAQCADVVLRIDPTVTLKFVTVREEGTPLWQVLQDVAKQSELEVLPQDNALYLRQVVAQDPNAEAAPPAAARAALAPYIFRYGPLKREKEALGSTSDRLSVLPRPTPAKEPAPAGLGTSKAVKAPPKPDSPEHPSQVADRGRQPDRTVWPAAWGNLPERGCATPKSDVLPPLVLAPIVTEALEPPAVQLGARLKSAAPRRGKAVRTRK